MSMPQCVKWIMGKRAILFNASLAKYPQDYYGHEYLGNIYLALGDSARAEQEYARAYELLPSENNEKMLTAIRKRRANEEKKTKQ